MLYWESAIWYVQLKVLGFNLWQSLSFDGMNKTSNCRHENICKTGMTFLILILPSDYTKIYCLKNVENGAGRDFCLGLTRPRFFMWLLAGPLISNMVYYWSYLIIIGVDGDKEFKTCFLHVPGKFPLNFLFSEFKHTNGSWDSHQHSDV